MINVSNEEFLRTIFGDDYVWSHVTCFPDDPSNISNENRMRCWAGNYFNYSVLQPNTNQYFTISLFYCDDQQKARRRKALFRKTHVIVADDVNEKLPVENVLKLPAPTYKLQTSPGSEQWGWVLTEPCSDRHRVENLLDGLVAQGLAPEGKDPGMKGVTRYVRLPEGVNTKASKLVNGMPTSCQILEWNPHITVSLDQLADPFNVDLDAERREGRIDGASAVDDHPIVNIPHIINIKEVRSPGRYEITCPWVASHTGRADDGAGVFTNEDGSIGFKCHHGSCEHRTGKDLLEHIERSAPGFTASMEQWKLFREFGKITGQSSIPDTNPQPSTGTLNFMGTVPAVPEVQPDQLIGYQDLIDALKKIPPLKPEATLTAYEVLKAVDKLDHGSRLNWWMQVRDHMDWSKQDLQAIIEQQRKVWYPATEKDANFYREFVYIAEQNQFYNLEKRMWVTAEAFQNAYSHLDMEARAEALVNGRVEKVDRLDYAPGMPSIFTEDGVKYANAWTDCIERGAPGDVQRWLDHFDVLGWKEEKEHVLKWMAYTLRHPERKINHMLILGGGEGNGKDFLLYPLIRAMSRNQTTIDGDELLRDFNDYLLSTKYLHINEAEHGDRTESRAVVGRLKSLAAAPPDTLRVNPKGVKPIQIRNIVNTTMTTNKAVPLELNDGTRRYFALWTEVSIRGEDGQMTEEWVEYWRDRWYWIRDCEGWKACVDYLFTQVDLSQFDPGKPPMVTEFVKEIQESTEDPLATAIRELKFREASLMASDLVTSQDIKTSLQSLAIQDLGISLKHIPNPHVIGKVMKQYNLGASTRVWRGSESFRVWIIRDRKHYETLNGRELCEEYHRQMSKIASGTNLSVVKEVEK